MIKNEKYVLLVPETSAAKNQSCQKRLAVPGLVLNADWDFYIYLYQTINCASLMAKKQWKIHQMGNGPGTQK